jgi:hypothetical protein
VNVRIGFGGLTANRRFRSGTRLPRDRYHAFNAVEEV